MNTLILIVQTFSGATAYEFGPYPDVKTCEVAAIKKVEEIQLKPGVLKVASDCRLLHPELQSIQDS